MRDGSTDAPMGVHLALGGGDDAALAHARWLGCTAAQIFTHSPQSFQFKPLDTERLARLRAGWKSAGVCVVVSHASYLINVASAENAKFHGAIGILRKELTYAAAFGCQYVVLHVGKHTTSTMEEGIAQVVRGITKVEDVLREGAVMLLLETAAGQGTEIGSRFDEIGRIIGALPVDVAQHVGVCVDTCHVFAAGYDIASDPDGVVRAMEAGFGLARLKVIHVNDSKGGLGDHKDRHENLGKGQIGIDGLRAFLTHPKIAPLPKILETPFADQKEQRVDMDALRGLVR